MKRILLAVFAISIGLYPVLYLLFGKNFGILNLKSDDLWSQAIYQSGFFTHIVFGGASLILGWAQFMPGWRRKYPKVHRNMGKGYVAAALLTSLASIYLSFYAEGGVISKVGFFCLGWIFLLTTLRAYQAARAQDFLAHERWMVFSYAACFAAVTLRLWMPILVPLLGDFIPAYRIVAWLCWVPNMVFAWWITRE
jgi:uncharacterized membrane protein